MWSRLYVNAILATDSRKLLQRIREAEWAIRERLSSSLPIDRAEQELMTGARARLRLLKTEFNASLKQMRRTVLLSKD
jgi:hypothetical protein